MYIASYLLTFNQGDTFNHSRRYLETVPEPALLLVSTKNAQHDLETEIMIIINSCLTLNLRLS